MYLEDHLRTIDFFIKDDAAGETCNCGDNQQHWSIEIASLTCMAIDVSQAKTGLVRLPGYESFDNLREIDSWMVDN